MKDEQIYQLMKLLPEEYLDEDLQYHMQRAAEPSRPHRLSYRIAALLRRRKTEPLHNKIDELMRETVCREAARRAKRNHLKVSQTKKKQEDFMKEEKHACKLNKASLLLICAIVLALGGTAAAVGYSLHKQMQDSQNELENELFEDDTPLDLEHAVISPKLTNQLDQAECHQFAKTQSGFYYKGKWKKSGTDHEIIMQDSSTYTWYETYPLLRYFDENSGETVTVCAKPNCLHDGNEFCVATTKNYEVISGYVYLDGYVYAVALDNIELNKNPEGCTKFPTVLLRYAPDGTEVTAIATLRESQYQSMGYSYSGMYVEMIAHRGQLWVYLPYNEQFTVKDENMQIVEAESRGGYEMYCYEPETKKVTVLATTGEPQKDYYPYTAGAPCMRGIGNYVYFHKVAGDWRDPVKSSGVYRIDCRTGLIEQVLNLKSEKSAFYTVSGDDIYYSFITTSNQSATDASFFKYDMKTQETTELIPFFDLAKTKADWLDKEKTGYDFGRNADIGFSNIIAAEGYVYVPWNLNDHRDEDETLSYNYITRFDADGNYETVDLGNAKGTELPEDYVRSYVEKNGYWDNKTETCTKPEDLTEADIQKAIKDQYIGSQPLTFSSLAYDRGYFYFNEFRCVYRITQEELFGDMNVERLFLKDTDIE